MGEGRNGHAILGPSASGRWIACPASVRMIRDLGPAEEDSIYAQEGTLFHTLCEVVASYRLLGGEVDHYDIGMLDWALNALEDWHDDQLRYVEEWIILLQEYLDEEEGAELHLEVVVDTGIPGCWGTADAVIVYPSGRIRVIDIKYGAGVKVICEGNSQLRLYGVGALETLIKDPLTVHEVITTVWQPRMDNLSEEVLTRHELLNWRDDIIPIAKLALGEDAPFGPSEQTCRWCPVAGICKPRANKMLAIDFGHPDALSGDEMAEAYSKISELSQWLNDIQDAALKMAHDEEGSVPGYKVVRSNGRRYIADEVKAIEILVNAGYDREAVERTSIQTLGALDKLVGSKDELGKVLGDLVGMSEGRLCLAPLSDSRPPADAVHSAKTDFAGITHQGDA